MRFTLSYLSGSFITLMMVFYFLKGLYTIIVKTKLKALFIFSCLVSIVIYGFSEVLNIDDPYNRIWLGIGVLILAIVTFMIPFAFLKPSEEIPYKKRRLKGLLLASLLIAISLLSWGMAYYVQEINVYSLVFVTIFMYCFFFGSNKILTFTTTANE